MTLLTGLWDFVPTGLLMCAAEVIACRIVGNLAFISHSYGTLQLPPHLLPRARVIAIGVLKAIIVHIVFAVVKRVCSVRMVTYL